MKVKMLVQTIFNCNPVFEGEEVEVDDKTAKRWADRGIAYIMEEVGTAKAESLSAKELYALCKEKGLDVEPKKSAKYYEEALAKAEQITE